MRRTLALFVPLACLVGLVFAYFGTVLLQDRQLNYRDSAHYYYPLYLRVQQEWDAGRVPLWEPEENGGMPLLGNPTAAVLYPGKIIYALFPYPWAAKLYAVAHVVLAAVAMALLVRSFGLGLNACAIGAFSYAFGMPVFFQYCNIIYLVGAAWLPLGVLGVDAWLRRRRRWGLPLLAVAMAMQTLGGDPETSYLLGIAAAAYAYLLYRRERPGWPLKRIAIAVGLAWLVFDFGVAAAMPIVWTALPQSGKMGPDPENWGTYLISWRFWDKVVLACWVVAGAVLLARARKRAPEARLRDALLGLLAAAAIATALMGAQLLPILEYTRRTSRAVADVHEYYQFSLEPIRWLETLWPSVFGTTLGANAHWLATLVPGEFYRIWEPSLYVGGVTLVLAGIGAFTSRAGALRTWLLGLLIVSALGATGRYASPIWAARKLNVLTDVIGEGDPARQGELRQDGRMPDGFGGPYWLMAQGLPGFRSFRYPSKLLTFTSLAVSCLAALGWEHAGPTPLRRARRAALALAGLSLALLIATYLFESNLRGHWKTTLQALPVGGFGPFAPDLALAQTREALLHGVVLFAALAILPLLTWPRRAGAGAALLVLLALDLAVANARYVMSCPQALFDVPPRALVEIERAEREAGSNEPYRVHRMPIWEPARWFLTSSTDRARDFLQWERRTLQPKHGIPYGLQYTFTQGVGELFDYWFFFAPFHGNPSPETARRLGLKPDEKLVYYPRRGFDMWNTKYFILPRLPHNNEDRGFYSLYINTEPIYPEWLSDIRPEIKQQIADWDRDEDWQIVRNPRAFPRAWVVHSARTNDPIQGMVRQERARMMEEILYQADGLWISPDRVLHDPRSTAWIEHEDPASLFRFQPGGPTSLTEHPRVTVRGPRRVEIDVTMERPGLLILADVYYPGWKLLVDGRPAEVLRANRMMRGAALDTGNHHLVYFYDPLSFRIGLGLSAAGLLALFAALAWSARRPRGTLERQF